MPTRQGVNPAKNGMTSARRNRLRSTTWPCIIDAVDLEHVLGEIYADGGNLHDGRSLILWRS